LSNGVARLALVLHGGVPGVREQRLAQILSFLGVPWAWCGLADLVNPQTALTSRSEHAVLGSVDTVAAATRIPGAAAALRHAAAVYAYASEDRRVCEEALEVLLDRRLWRVMPPPSHAVALDVSNEVPEITGPMSGLEVTVALSGLDSLLSQAGETRPHGNAIISANGCPLFFAIEAQGIPLYFSASAAIVDLDEPAGRNYYDVKDHFASAVPLVMFLTCTFATVMWRPSELGACLIIDDPLLKSRYGFCDFPRLRDLMREHRFTTNIAFIPWNSRRTTVSGSELFRREPELFSVSIHGCDHTAAEFAETSGPLLDSKAALAQTRMRRHQARTGLPHDSIMVFPQGVFSSACPAALKRHEFIAAVNTEVNPVDAPGPLTTIRDVWDVAITRYGTFPVFTRRYPFHGLENFAFDMLLGKPCLIVTHHQFFKDDCVELLDFIGKLRDRRSSLTWRPLGEVIRRSCRRRPSTGNADEEIEMYGSELVADNPASLPVEVTVRKREENAAMISGVSSREGSIPWSLNGGQLVFGGRIQPDEQAFFAVTYKPAPKSATRRSVGLEASVAARRLLSEFRDEYLQKFARTSA